MDNVQLTTPIRGHIRASPRRGPRKVQGGAQPIGVRGNEAADGAARKAPDIRGGLDVYPHPRAQGMARPLPSVPRSNSIAVVQHRGRQPAQKARTKTSRLRPPRSCPGPGGLFYTASAGVRNLGGAEGGFEERALEHCPHSPPPPPPPYLLSCP
ncbi:hypothetical protein GWK47_042672 [Chionoecetes opilio]|uniref:Uncharacterized protein n=1 Tax=Chionoecetes opilio TaxID=41210 RepID=A0A8J4YMQ6_CHIOP|nr:hypothetical protein GWK47_042672 [Chionoecetes opilio]